MIVIDTSALIAVLFREPGHERISALIATTPRINISAATLTETLIVALGRNASAEMQALLAEFDLTVEPVTHDRALQAATAYAKWGKGLHPARLNFGDCFAYALAAELSVPLLFVGNDFAATDAMSALA